MGNSQSPIADTFGLLYLGVVFGGMLYGISVVQIYIYANRYSSDPWGIKVFVGYIIFVDTIHQSLLTYAMWHYLIDCYWTPTQLLVVHWSFEVYLMASILIAFSVQLFYTYRIWALTRHAFVCTLIILSGLLYVGFGAYFDVQMAKTPVWTTVLKKTWALDVSIGFSVAADICIAAAMSFILWRRCPDSGYERTYNVIHRLINYAIGTGLLTVVLSLLILIMLAANPSNYLPELLFVILPKLYTNSALISLNARESMRAQLRQPFFMPSTSNIPVTSVHLCDMRKHGDLERVRS